MQMIQNKALREICFLNWRDNVTACYFSLNILKIYDVAKLETAKFVHKLINLPTNLSKYFLIYFNMISAAHNYCTRTSSNDKFVLPLFKTKRAQKSIKYQGSKE